MITNYTFKVAGVPHHVDDFFEALAVENSDYNLSKKEIKEDFSDGDKIFEYDFVFSKVELIPEDTNPYDSNAVRIEADGHVVGYIGKKDTLKVRELLKAPDLFKIELSLAGGNYKYVYEDDNEKMQVEEKSYGYFGDVIIKVGTPEEIPLSTVSIPADPALNMQPIKKAAPRGLVVVELVLGVILGLMSLLLLLLSPVAGVLVLIFAVILIVFGVKGLKKPKEEGRK